MILRMVIIAAFAVIAGRANAGLEEGKAAMVANDFKTALVEFLPAAQAGNADAEELIGVLYAMGLGVERDDRRAFDWYLRASLKSHPGAQSGIGWYYEIGRGMPAPDLVRAYAWYTLSAIGGDPDAAISQEEIAKKMTPEQIAEALVLVKDYRPHLYPAK
jgi:TPR repeat protein